MSAGPPHLRSSLVLALMLCDPLLADDLFLDNTALPQVLTATRLKQSAAAVPGSMTVIDSELIKASGARDISELLRLVPGMMVGNVSGNQAAVNYHGTNASEARRMQVLIDGRSVYRAGLATVDWSDIPVAMEDIERIEVFRGPNTVSYGANALMAVVNIITRAPANSHGTRLKVARGERGINDWYASQGSGWETGDLRLSLSGQEDDGFDSNRLGADYRDSRRLNRVNLAVSQTLNEQQSIDWQLNAKDGTNQRPYTYRPVFSGITSAGDNSDVIAKDYAGSLRWNLELNPDHSLYVQGSAQHWDRQQVWRACDAEVSFSPQLTQLWQLDPNYAERLARHMESYTGTGAPHGTPTEQALANQVLDQWKGGANRTVCGDIDQSARESRYDLELQDTLSLSDSLRLVSGMNYRYDRADSETYFNGTLDDSIWRLFGQLEWRASEHWLLQGGAMYEKTELVGDSLTPRVAINYLINPRHGLRAVYSEAIRSPDMFENNVNWSYQVTNLSPGAYGQSSARYFVKTRGPGNLAQEHMRSRELGYNGFFADLGLNVDVKLFYDEITDMISEPLRNNQYIASNSNASRFSGSETQLDWRVSTADRLRLTYAYVDATASNPLDEQFSARNSGSAGWLRDWGNGWNSALFYYGDDALNGYRFERIDTRIAKRIALGKANLELAGILQQRLDSQPTTFVDNNYDSRHALYFSAELEF
ncbi:ligand-gated channel protein [Pseudomonas sp. FW306-02-F02-AA]|uniref:TonB-dependent receptor n=1 Tax=Pseudomonas fluorescens TaxID=294 RepID=A0A0N9W6G6_PSEFL|nr:MULTISPECIES: TonB-dependent receptor [Pseudomonas]ALH99824.1 TonB-dependent receptor [Pseudomonas fluorescens]PMZ03090.1 ligand-gated channel protein [Pseudomonas sp. FW306-02-F02-AB]PMZ08925.1 ligand-gated channel protein [Pseudomonas sp. FW306-02-H06C]PMZ12730.1 ligand-gated channel protein [Pseudomonas sp. FW306-02-F02-AA]PMZ18862.1 ligand-gated channel protein [Pseudomonas sp. FW306-02-F08-AA]